MAERSTPQGREDPPETDESRSESSELAPPSLSEIGKNESDPGDGPDGGSLSASGSGAETEALVDPERLRELQESLSRLEGFAAQSQAENTTRAYAADLEDFRHWCKKYDREWLPATPKTIGRYLGAQADELSLATLDRHLAAIAPIRREEVYKSLASVTEGLFNPLAGRCPMYRASSLPEEELNTSRASLRRIPPAGVLQENIWRSNSENLTQPPWQDSAC